MTVRIPNIMIEGALVLEGTSLKFTYIDTGAPEAGSKTYKTIFAVHGMGFSARIFAPFMARAKEHGLRVVAINRRSYSGSTPFSLDEILQATAGSDLEKEHFKKTRGLELLSFVNQFICDHALPAVDGVHGGSVLLGWSAGNGVVFSALSQVNILSEVIQTRLAAHLRECIIFDPVGFAIGSHPPALGLQHSLNLPPESYLLWITSYFDHPMFNGHDKSTLELITPSFTRTPTLRSICPSDLALILEMNEQEITELAVTMPQALLLYRKACYDASIRAQLPHLQFRVLYGEKSSFYALAAVCDMLDDNANAGGGWLKFKMLPEGNHFAQWDDVDTFLQAVQTALCD